MFMTSYISYFPLQIYEKKIDTSKYITENLAILTNDEAKQNY